MIEWKETRLKGTLSAPLVYGLNVSSEYDDRDLPRYIRITDFDDYNNLSEDTFKSLPIDLAEPAMLKEGDLLFARSGATVGKTFLYHTLPYGACYAGYLIRARLNKKVALPEFISYYTKSVEYSNWKNRTYIQATIQNLSAEKYNQLPINLPSLTEQNRIVTYLDGKTSVIDNQVSLLSKKRDAYLHLKKSVINRAVTKGLDSNVKFKDSGVEWIGEIPVDWNTRRLKDFITLQKGKTPKELDFESDDYPYLTMDYLRSRTDKNIYYPVDSEGLILIEANEILVLWDGANAGEFLLSKKGYLGSTMAVLNINEKKLDKDYLLYFLKSLEGTCKYFADGTTIPHLDSSLILNHSYPIPPIREQQSIAAYLDEKCSRIDAIIKNIDTQIEKYKLLKRALINEVVTGKRAV